MSSEAKIKEKLNIFESKLLKKEYLKQINLFVLKEYLTTRLINILLENNINLYNVYLNGDIEISDLGLSNYNKIKIMNAIETIIKTKRFKLEIDDLLFFGINPATIIKLKENNISFSMLGSLSEENLTSNYNLKKLESGKVLGIYHYILQHMEDNFKILDTYKILYEYLIYYTSNGKKSVSIFSLKQNMTNNNYYPIENFQKDLSKLTQKELIQTDSFGITMKKTKLIEILNSKCDGRDLEIVKERLNGATFEATGNKYDVTRERIRQIFEKNMEKVYKEKIEEDKYKEIFEEYNWDEKYFVEIFSEEPSTFYYLKYKFKSGQKDLIQILEDNRFSTNQKRIYKSINTKLFDKNGELKVTFDKFIVILAKKYAERAIKIDRFYFYYNKERKMKPSFNLPNLNIRSFEARISRSDYIVFLDKRKMRYYNLNEITPAIQVKFNKIMLSLEDGFYSTKIILKNNKEFVERLQIKNEFELHNLLRRKIIIEDKRYKLIKMPSFLIGYDSVTCFYNDIIEEYSPIEVKKLAKKISNKYGLNKETAYSYISANYASEIHNEIINIEISKNKSKYTKVFKQVLKKEIYSTKELDENLKENNIKKASSEIHKEIFKKAGYTYRGNYIIKNKYSSINGYLNNKSKKSAILKFSEDLIEISAIQITLDQYCKKHKLFKIDAKGKVYITIKKLNEAGLTMKKIKTLIMDLKENFMDADYFSINNIYREIDVEAFDKLGFDEEFFENFISSIDGIRVLRINNNKLFKFSKKNLTRKTFMDDMINKYSSINIGELQNEIYNKYQIEINYDKLKHYAKSADIFYSDIYDKIYLDKEDYYKEVYGE